MTEGVKEVFCQRGSWVAFYLDAVKSSRMPVRFQHLGCWSVSFSVTQEAMAVFF